MAGFFVPLVTILLSGQMAIASSELPISTPLQESMAEFTAKGIGGVDGGGGNGRHSELASYLNRIADELDLAAKDMERAKGPNLKNALDSGFAVRFRENKGRLLYSPMSALTQPKLVESGLSEVEATNVFASLSSRTAYFLPISKASTNREEESKIGIIYVNQQKWDNEVNTRDLAPRTAFHEMGRAMGLEDSSYPLNPVFDELVDFRSSYGLRRLVVPNFGSTEDDSRALAEKISDAIEAQFETEANYTLPVRRKWKGSGPEEWSFEPGRCVYGSNKTILYPAVFVHHTKPGLDPYIDPRGIRDAAAALIPENTNLLPVNYFDVLDNFMSPIRQTVVDAIYATVEQFRGPHLSSPLKWDDFIPPTNQDANKTLIGGINTKNYGGNVFEDHVRAYLESETGQSVYLVKKFIDGNPAANCYFIDTTRDK